MTAEQKQCAAAFLDMADDYLRCGHRSTPRIYNFTDDVERPAAAAAFTAAAACGQAPAQAGAGAAPGEREAALRAVAGEIAACTRCPLAVGRRNVVPGEGAAGPLVFVLGEGPGADEDAQGRPFVGPAGKLLDKMLAAIGLCREKNCFIGNTVKCRPPGNRDPEPVEKAACRAFLDRQIAILTPQVILAVGRVPAQTLLETTEGITRLRGQWANIVGSRGEKILVLPTFHPSYLLRDDRQKPLAWEDLKKLSRRLATLDARYDRDTAELRKKHKI
ncbi:MAG: uracil-DNA glycosylase [Spirochaetaceae bacterium]|jgi:DNA polymerase|nr:uracil-DNA glycosylase [Spirochaetaceae bacterium]